MTIAFARWTLTNVRHVVRTKYITVDGVSSGSATRGPRRPPSRSPPSSGEQAFHACSWKSSILFSSVTTHAVATSCPLTLGGGEGALAKDGRRYGRTDRCTLTSSLSFQHNDGNTSRGAGLVLGVVRRLPRSRAPELRALFTLCLSGTHFMARSADLNRGVGRCLEVEPPRRMARLPKE